MVGTTEALLLGSFLGGATDNLEQKIRPVLGKENWIGKIVLQYYEGDDPIHRTVPFYENASIQESQSSRLAKYSPIGRASNSFTYLGAESRDFKLRFNITLPHLYQENATEGSNKRRLTKEEKKAIVQSVESAEGVAKYRMGADFKNVGKRYGAYRYDEHYYDVLDEMDKKLWSWSSNKSPLFTLDSDGAKERQKVINKIASFVASIRSSTVNNAQNPVYGTPIVRLSYGILYDNVPCVCDNYSIGFDPDAGFDVRTMLPRMITVSMSLKEVRNFPDDAVSQVGSDVGPIDNLQGWEVILADLGTYGITTDPGGDWQ